VRRTQRQMDRLVAALHLKIDQHVPKRRLAAGPLEQIDRLLP